MPESAFSQDPRVIGVHVRCRITAQGKETKVEFAVLLTPSGHVDPVPPPHHVPTPTLSPLARPPQQIICFF